MARGKYYTSPNIHLLFDLAENQLPIGLDEWNHLALNYNNAFPNDPPKTGEDLRTKFKTLKNSKKPTGDPTCPPEIIRLK